MGLRIAFGLIGVILVVGVLVDAFESIILPRRIDRPIRLASGFYKVTWRTWLWCSQILPRGGGRYEGTNPRESFLSLYGPLSSILLLAVWAIGLIIGFGLIEWVLGPALVLRSGMSARLDAELFASGATFLGTVSPHTGLAAAVIVVEAGVGVAFLALVIAYLPVLYQAFSTREAAISLLDARAGSPPCAVELLTRSAAPDLALDLDLFLRGWESWTATLLESHLSYPPLIYFRSQHEHQSWLGALTMVADACALVLTGIDEIPPRQARRTLAIVRHAVVDLSQVLGAAPRPPAPDRLPPEDLIRLRRCLAAAGLRLREGGDAEARLAELRALYEPHVGALSAWVRMPLPPWLHPEGIADDWQTTPWDGSGPLPML